MPERRARRLRISSLAAVLVALPLAGGALQPTRSSSSVLAVYVGMSAGNSQAFTSAGPGGQWTAAPTLDLPDVGASAYPTFGDLDRDGDLDAMVGEAGGFVRALRDTGTESGPVWARTTAWESTTDFGSQVAPALVDIDRDGDLDLLIGNASGDLDARENVGSATAPAWADRPAWRLGDVGGYARPAAGNLNGDAYADLLVGRSGNAIGYVGTGDAAAPFVPAAQWDLPVLSTNVSVALTKLDGDARADALVVDGGARLVGAFRNTGSAFAAEPSWMVPLDAGSGPGGIAAAWVGPTVPSSGSSTTSSSAPTSSTTTRDTAPPTTSSTPATTPAPQTTTAPTTMPGPGNRAPVAVVSVTPPGGPPPINITVDASGSRDADGDALTYAFDFGDGTSSGPAPSVPSDPAAAIVKARDAYNKADATREGGNKGASILLYLDAAYQFDALTSVTATSPFSAKDGKFTTIDQVSRYYLMKIGHDLGAIYLYNTAAVHGLEGCARYEKSYLYSLDGVRQAELGGFGALAGSNGTAGNRNEAKDKLIALGCAVPPYQPMFQKPVVQSLTAVAVDGGPTVTHTYGAAGTYTVTARVSDGTNVATAKTIVVVGTVAPPVTPPGSTDGEKLEGFGATFGGSGGDMISITEPTTEAIKSAFARAKQNSVAGKKSRIVFEVMGPIIVTSTLTLEADNVTVEGNGVTLLGGPSLSQSVAGLLEVRSHDVIVRDVRVRNGGDNLRAQGTNAHHITFSHVTSTGSMDDGISIGYGAHDVTVQYSFFAGNTRSIFIKYGGVNNITLHHNWIMKQWIRGPLANHAFVDFRNNIVEDWTMWGVRYEDGASGNVVNSTFGYSAYARQTFGKPANGLNVKSSDEHVYVSGIEFRGEATEGPNADGNVAVEFPAPAVSTQSVAQMEGLVHDRAGALPRDAIDAQYINRHGEWRIGDNTPLRLLP